MHFEQSRLADAEFYVEVQEPWTTSDGKVMPPSLTLRPFGETDFGARLSMDLDEAEAMAAALTDGVRQARELFPG